MAFKEALTPEWKAYQRQIVANAAALAKGLQGEGWRLVSGGTDTHPMLVEVKREVRKLCAASPSTNARLASYEKALARA